MYMQYRYVSQVTTFYYLLTASDYRQEQTCKEKERRLFDIDLSGFATFFEQGLQTTSEMIKDNNLRKTSTKGKVIIEMTENILCQNQIKNTLLNKLSPYFFKIFQSAGSSTTSTNEVLYSSFYEVTENLILNSELQNVLAPIENTMVWPFVGVLLHSLMRTLIKNRSELFEKVHNENVRPLDDNEQLVLYQWIYHMYTKQENIETVNFCSARKAECIERSMLH